MPCVNLSMDQLMLEKLEQLRAKLLDLSLANRLLNFKHASRARNHLRVIHHSPSLLWEHLRLQSLSFAPLPPLDEEPEDESHPDFIQAWQAARLTDSTYRNAISEVEEREERVQQIERSLKDRLRQSLGLPSRSSLLPSLAEHAKRFGIDPSFNLSQDSTFCRDSIQLLLLPQTADQQLMYVRDAARQRLEETGSNMLFCAFGFLQWYETLDSTTPLYAPLLLLPVEIKREIRQQQVFYTLACTGEEPFLNLTLKAKLRQLGLVLPEWEESDDPEAYWQKITPFVQAQKRWQIRRWITVGIFPFSRMAMYEDLDPKRYPELAAHTQTRSLLLGHEPSKNPGGKAFQEEDKNISLTPLLISPTDASQYAALCKALKCPSLIIKGPPGTGKSQTIANLIAASLARGENVLFVADKQAALQVVFSRLKKAGLDDFCLELHSYQATRAHFIQSLKKRLDMTVAKKTENVEAKMREVQSLRSSLDQYLQLITQPLGQSQLSIQSILWSARQATDKAQVPSSLFKTYLDQPEHLSPEKIQHHKQVLDTLEKAYSLTIKAKEHLYTHPWRGCTPSSLSPFEIEEIEEACQTLIIQLQAMKSHCDSFRDAYGIELKSIEEIEQLVHQLSQLLMVDEDIPATFFPRTEDMTKKVENEQLLNMLQQFQAYAHSLQVDFSTLFAFPLAQLEKLNTLYRALPFTISSLTRLNSEIEHCQKQIGLLQQLQELSDGLAFAFGLNPDLSFASLKSIWSAVHYLAHLPPSVFMRRLPSLFDEQAHAALDQARQQAQRLNTMRQELEQIFYLEKCFSSLHLMPYLQQLQKKNFWNFFKPSFYQLRRFYRKISRNVCQPPHQMAFHLQVLHAYLKECTLFEQDKVVQKFCGSYFKGINTDFTSLLEVVQFGLEVKKRFASTDAIHTAIHSTLLDKQETHLQSIAAYTKHPMAFALNNFFTLSHLNFEQNFSCLIENWKNYQAKLVELQQCLTESSLPNSFKIEKLPQWLEMAQLAQQIKHKIEACHPSFADRNFSLDPSLFLRIRKMLVYEQQIYQQPILARLSSFLLHPPFEDVKKDLELYSQVFTQSLHSIKRQWDIMQSKGGIDEKWFFDAPGLFVQQTWQTLMTRLQSCARHPDLLSSWFLLGKAMASAKQEGLDSIYFPFILAKQPLTNLRQAYELVLYRSLARYAYTLDGGTLSHFNGMDQEQALARLEELDEEMMQLARESLRSFLWERPIPPGIGYGRKADYTDLALIKHEVSKQRRYLPIRHLMRRAKEALRVLKPCVLMSPLSVAHHLPRDGLTFDLVVIDEASQMRPEEAIGAISRAKRAVIVGDPLQLPPTDFFMKVEEASLEEEIEESSHHDSILDLALATFPDSCELRWHYRSQHESLMAFSNHHFYQNRLIVFPSAHRASSDLGIQYIPIQGVYQAGVNPIEAQAVMRAVLEFMQRYPERSLGIVTINHMQRDLLLEEFEYATHYHPHAAAYRARWETTLQPPFVKNLENVQGDERDAIFISLVYGPNDQGVVSQNFGPINKTHGHRRLNVLFTRARLQLLLFSSLLPDQIKTEGKNLGVSVLKNYLEFASTGRLEIGVDSHYEPESDFERCVAEKIRAMGCKVVPQVGVAGYRIDMGVYHPSYPYGYLLGIECDGASYHSSQTARIRDHLRQSVLERLGWTIYRIWSTDWFRDPLMQTKRLETFIQELVLKKTQELTKS